MEKIDAAIALVKREYLGKKADVFTVWQCKTLQNWKGIFGCDLDNRLFEVTYNGDKKEYYIDCYEKQLNKKYDEYMIPTISNAVERFSH